MSKTGAPITFRAAAMISTDATGVLIGLVTLSGLPAEGTFTVEEARAAAEAILALASRAEAYVQAHLDQPDTARVAAAVVMGNA